MVKYFACVGLLKSSWDQVCIAFWERYPNPYSNHVLTEDIIFRDVTPGNRLVSRRLLTKTNRAPRWMEKYLPVTMARHAYIIEDSIVDPQNRTMTTLTWNISHARMMSVEERCEYRINPDNSSWTEINREAWISSNLYGLSRAIQVRPPPGPWLSMLQRGPGRRLWQLKRKLKTWPHRLTRNNSMSELPV
ncbi:PRELI domain containing 1a isoform X2 [Salvelinus alpinus]|uniref:PRELI domain containing 1a isoform X2 n=1 Tax=Salvelinus alpinus TaxID=8036 RepID=UPI0039FDDFF2